MTSPLWENGTRFGNKNILYPGQHFLSLSSLAPLNAAAIATLFKCFLFTLGGGKLLISIFLLTKGLLLYPKIMYYEKMPRGKRPGFESWSCCWLRP